MTFLDPLAPRAGRRHVFSFSPPTARPTGESARSLPPRSLTRPPGGFLGEWQLPPRSPALEVSSPGLPTQVGGVVEGREKTPGGGGLEGFRDS